MDFGRSRFLEHACHLRCWATCELCPFLGLSCSVGCGLAVYVGAVCSGQCVLWVALFYDCEYVCCSWSCGVSLWLCLRVCVLWLCLWCVFVVALFLRAVFVVCVVVCLWSSRRTYCRTTNGPKEIPQLGNSPKQIYPGHTLLKVGYTWL